jgi:UDP-GlcNAc:undecaprenyl-phosphate/decaprenyl-phosphate GlcNAc-1-phosphate transferase
LHEILLIAKLSITFLATFYFIKIIIRFASLLGFVDIPNHRSSHTIATPRGAGIGIVFGVMVSDLLFLNNLIVTHFAIFMAIFIVFIVGVLDDHRDASAKTKFYVIFAAVLLLAYDDIVVHSLGHLFGYQIALGWFAIPFTMFAVAGFTNALNLSDGLDGLAGSLSVIILATLCVIGYENNDLFIVSTSLSFIAAILAFMWFNWNPAKIFMGDSGSLTLGFVISVLAIKSLEYVQPAVVLFIAAIPILDTIIVIIRRYRTGHSILSPDKLHIHHVLLHFFDGKVKKTVVFIALLQLFCSGIGFNISDGGYKQIYILGMFIVIISIMYLLLNGMIDTQRKPLSYYRNKKKRR